jgi:hypothetical protein
MFSWLDAREAQEFGMTLAKFFMERIPMDEPGKKAKSLEKKQEVVQKMVQQIQIFRIDHKMNLYKKAKLANAFKWALLDAHYPSEFVDELTTMLLVNF